MDDCRSDDNSDAEYLPSQDQMDDEETSDEILVLRSKKEEEADSHDSNRHDSIEFKEMKVRNSETQNKVGTISLIYGGPERQRRSQAITPDGPNRFKYRGMSFQLNEEDQTYTCDTCGFKSSPKLLSIKQHLLRHVIKPTREKEKPKPPKTMVIPDGPNTYNYNGHCLKLNDEDQCYFCGACEFKGTTNMHSVLNHIREIHYTEEDKLKFTAVRTSDTEWLYGGVYKIVAMGEKVKCVSCGFIRFNLNDLILHIRTQHVDTQGEQEEAPLPVTDQPSVIDPTPIQGVWQSVPYTFNPADNKYICGICQAQISGSSRRNFGHHIKIRHTDAALKVICEVCGKELINQLAYKKHLQKHQAEPKSCPTCDKKFFDDRNFKRHLKVHAFGDAAKKYQCEYCGKKFILPAQCRTHVMIHTGEKPFQCQDCGKGFRCSSGLSKHRHQVHGFKRGTRNLIRINE